ncbi:COG1361 S-layer family protein [uncultured Methanofollis sp.]|uniref:COG1361 S-layer family protein n=1 Tax=uncultured Methanofollis sp. TaxID=262500 RepID=UPI002615589F|nr:S-layer protein [uncultured Methanofollis sp.]
MDIRKFCILGLVLAALTAPALAGTEFLYGSPEMSAAISGTNMFVPGTEVPVTVIISNSGTNSVMVTDPKTITPQDPPNLAKLVNAGLSAGDAPVEIRSDAQQIGDIPGGVSKPVTFLVKFDKDAPAGTYDLPLTLKYQYVDWTEQDGGNLLRTGYLNKKVVLPLAVTVRSNVNLEVDGVSTDHINVGTEGYLTLTLRNAGFEHAQKAVAKLARDGASPLIPTDGNVYIGDFKPGDVVNCTFKVSASSDAEAQSYPVDVLVEYEKSNGEKETSDTEIVGVPVGGKIDFAIVSSASSVHPGQKATIDVTYKNIGSATAYNAQARISAVDPFTSNDDTAYLGDLEPGQTAVAHYTVSVDKEATVKQYGLDSEIRYRDALDNSQISDTMKMTVTVVKPDPLVGALTNPIIIAVIIAVLIGAGYYIYRRRTSE